MTPLAPVDYAIFAFPGNRFTGRIIPAIGELVEAGMIRILDAAFVMKDDAGAVTALDLTDVESDVRIAYSPAEGQISALFNDEDLAAVAEELPAGNSAALLVWENLWAGKVTQAIRDADGEVLDFGRIPHDIVQAAQDWALQNQED